MALTKVKLIADGVINVDNLAASHGITTDNIGEGLSLYYTNERVGTYLTANNYATQSFVTTAVSNLVDAAPSTLDTLNELAAALGDDPNFATTVTNSIASKLPLTGGTLTGSLAGTSATFSSSIDTYAGFNMVGGTSYLTINRANTASDGVIIFRDSSVNKWILGARGENTNNFYLYSYGTSGHPLVIDYSTGAATFSSRINGVVGGTAYNTAGFWLQGSNSTDGIAIGGTGGGDKTIDTYGGTLKINGTAGNGLSVTGAATFSDKVGIKRTPTNAMFEIEEGGLPAAPLFRFVGNAGNGNYMRGAWMQSDNSTQLAQLSVDGTVAMYFGTNSSTPLIITTSGSERMRIKSDGNVGIGTTSPEARLDVVSDSGGNGIAIRTRPANDWGWLIYDSHDSSERLAEIGVNRVGVGSGDLYFTTYNSGTGSTKMIIKPSGNVGIGTTSPVAKLEVNSSDVNTAIAVRSTDEGAYIGFADNTTTLDDGYPTVAVGAKGDNLIFSTNNAEKARINAVGDFSVSNGQQSANSLAAEILLGNRGYFSSSYIGAAKIASVTGSPNWYSGTGLVFYTNSGPDATSVSAQERLRILPSGGITFNGDTATANALDDYEEGTFTPTLDNAGTPNYSRQYGKYTKIGNLVFVTIKIEASSITSSGNTVSFNLPFTAADAGDTSQRSSGLVEGDWVGMGSYVDTTRFRVAGAYTQAVRDNGGSSVYLAYNNLDSSIEFNTSITYLT